MPAPRKPQDRLPKKAASSGSIVDGDTFTWFSTDPAVGRIDIPLKFKVGVLRKARDMAGDDLGFMFAMLDGIGVPAEHVDEMDAFEMKDMFAAWQVAWAERTGASLPESSGSSV